jgi:hypothetical protein
MKIDWSPSIEDRRKQAEEQRRENIIQNLSSSTVSNRKTSNGIIGRT